MASHMMDTSYTPVCISVSMIEGTNFNHDYSNHTQILTLSNQSWYIITTCDPPGPNLCDNEEKLNFGTRDLK